MEGGVGPWGGSRSLEPSAHPSCFGGVWQDLRDEAVLASAGVPTTHTARGHTACESPAGVHPLRPHPAHGGVCPCFLRRAAGPCQSPAQRPRAAPAFQLHRHRLVPLVKGSSGHFFQLVGWMPWVVIRGGGVGCDWGGWGMLWLGRVGWGGLWSRWWGWVGWVVISAGGVGGLWLRGWGWNGLW